MKINNQNQTSFGWKDVTHKKITEASLADTPELAKYQKDLVNFVQRPDFDENGVNSNSHFYFPFAEKKSFSDSSGSDNAYGRYSYHVGQIKTSLENNDKQGAIEHAGRALHFLQDVSEQHHSHQGNLFQKAQEQNIHIEFEDFIKDNQDKIFKNIAPKQVEGNKNFDDLFIKTAEYSARSDFATINNRDKWERLGQDGLSNAMHATREFLVKFNTLLKERNLQ
ncbi:MAG: hypothetical protein WCG95_03530 [bacterium]